MVELLAVCAVLFAPSPARAQLGITNAELTPIIESDGVLGATYGAAMAFELAAGAKDR